MSASTPPSPLMALRDAAPARDVEARIIEGALRRAQAPPRRPVWVPVLLASAAAAAAAFFVLQEPKPTPEPTVPTVIAQMPSSDAAPQPAFLITKIQNSPYTVEHPQTGTTRVRLPAGSAHFKVQKLKEGDLFEVRTPHARVEVVGTEFTVAVSDRCTTVSVDEGRVRVRHGGRTVFVSTGEHHEACATSSQGERTVRDALADIAGGHSDAARTKLTRYAQEHPEGLFLEEALFHLALLESQQQDTVKAHAIAQRFLARFPKGRRADRMRRLLTGD